jgi:hypothetical protein
MTVANGLAYYDTAIFMTAESFTEHAVSKHLATPEMKESPIYLS